MRKANRLLSTGYVARREEEAAPAAEVHVHQPSGVHDMVGLVYWAVMVCGVCGLGTLLPGIGKREPSAWELRVAYVVMGAGFLVVLWLWTKIAARIGVPICFTQGDLLLAQWKEAPADTWSLTAADGQELARAVWEPRLRMLMRLDRLRRCDFTAGDKELAYRPWAGGWGYLFPIELESDEFAVVVNTRGLFKRGWRIECLRRPGDEAGAAAREIQDPALLALYLGVFCIELMRRVF